MLVDFAHEVAHGWLAKSNSYGFCCPLRKVTRYLIREEVSRNGLTQFKSISAYLTMRCVIFSDSRGYTLEDF